MNPQPSSSASITTRNISPPYPVDDSDEGPSWNTPNLRAPTPPPPPPLGSKVANDPPLIDLDSDHDVDDDEDDETGNANDNDDLEKRARIERSRKEKLAPTDKVPTTYEAVILERLKPQPNQKASWSRVTCQALVADNRELISLIKAHRRKSKTTTNEDFDALSSTQQGLINNLLSNKVAAETNPRAVWLLVDVQYRLTTYENDKKIKRLQVVFKRHDRDAESIVDAQSHETGFRNAKDAAGLSTPPPTRSGDLLDMDESSRKWAESSHQGSSHKSKERNVDKPKRLRRDGYVLPTDSVSSSEDTEHLSTVSAEHTDDDGRLQGADRASGRLPRGVPAKHARRGSSAVQSPLQRPRPSLQTSFQEIPPYAGRFSTSQHEGAVPVGGETFSSSSRDAYPNPFMPWPHLVPPDILDNTSQAPTSPHSAFRTHSDSVGAKDAKRREKRSQKRIGALEDEVDELRFRIETLVSRRRSPRRAPPPHISFAHERSFTPPPSPPPLLPSPPTMSTTFVRTHQPRCLGTPCTCARGPDDRRGRRRDGQPSHTSLRITSRRDGLAVSPTRARIDEQSADALRYMASTRREGRTPRTLVDSRGRPLPAHHRRPLDYDDRDRAYTYRVEDAADERDAYALHRERTNRPTRPSRRWGTHYNY